jgi:transposase-like protein
MQHYSPEFKRGLAEQILTNPSMSVDELAEASGVARASLFRWIKQYGPCVAGVERKQIRPRDWSTAQRLRALLECQSLSEHEQGAYMRKHGLYYSDLARWKSEILDEVKKNRRSNSIPSSEASYQRRIRELERELQIKDAALREATALIALKKKAELIWGVAEEEKSPDPKEKTAKLSSAKRSKKAPG